MKYRWKYEGPVLINSNVVSTNWRGDVEAQNESEAWAKIRQLYLKQSKAQQHFRVYFTKKLIKMEAVG